MKYTTKAGLDSFQIVTAQNVGDLAMAFDAKSGIYIVDRLNALHELADALNRCGKAITEDKRLISTYEIRRVAAAIKQAYKLEGPC